MCLSGLQLVIWRSKVFPASAHAGRDGTVETGPGERPLLKVLRVPGGASGPRSRREDYAEWRQVLDRGGVPRDRWCDVQFCQRRLEPWLHTRHPIPAERILSPQLSSGRKPCVRFLEGSPLKGLTLFHVTGAFWWAQSAGGFQQVIYFCVLSCLSPFNSCITKSLCKQTTVVLEFSVVIGKTFQCFFLIFYSIVDACFNW